MLRNEIVETERRYRAIWLGGKIKLSLSNAKQYFSSDRKCVSTKKERKTAQLELNWEMNAQQREVSCN